MNITEHVALHDSAIRRLARKLARGDADLADDLYQTGMLILIKGHQGSYDHSRDTTLLSYAAPWIRKEMHKASRRQRPDEEVPTDPSMLPRVW